MTRILGIDPGSRRTGYGVVDVSGGKIAYVTSGIIRLPEKGLPERLKIIFDGVAEIVQQYQPQHMAVEEVFLARNPGSALKLGQARGALRPNVSGEQVTIRTVGRSQVLGSRVGR